MKKQNASSVSQKSLSLSKFHLLVVIQYVKHHVHHKVIKIFEVNLLGRVDVDDWFTTV